MATKMTLLHLQKTSRAFTRLSSKSTANRPSTPKPTQPSASHLAQTTDGKSYEVPEYYQHNEYTFFDYMIHMNSKRLQQPANK